MATTADRVTSTGTAIVGVLSALQLKFGKDYSYPSQEKLRELLARYHKIVISPRTLNRRLRFLEDNGFIYRVRRTCKGPEGRMLFRTTAYYVLHKAVTLAKVVAQVAKKIAAALHLPLMADYLKRHKDIYPPYALSVDNSSPPISYKDFLRGAKGLS